MGNQIKVEFEGAEDFYQYFTRCIDTVKASDGSKILLKEIAFRLGLSQQRLSHRMSLASDNTPRFGLNDLVLYMVTFNDWRPLDYLQWFKKKHEQENGQHNGKELREMKRQMEGMLSRIDGLIQIMEVEK